MKWLRFMAAVIVAILGGLWYWSRPWGRLRDAMYLAWDAFWLASVDSGVYKARLKACEGCVVFYRPLRTCGTPLQNHDMGCWCQMEQKAKLAHARCWLRQEYGPKPKYGALAHGWDDDL